MKLVPNRLRFTLRTLFIVVTVLCVFLGRIVYLAQEQKQAVAAVESTGPLVVYDFGKVTGTMPPGPAWLWSVVDKNLCFDVKYVWLGKSATDDTLRQVGKLRHVQLIKIVDAPGITDRGLEHVKGLSHLSELWVLRTSVTQRAAKELERPDRRVYWSD
jgi:hypothetical protein